MTQLRDKCEGCGQCCRAIYIPIAHTELVSDISVLVENRIKERIVYEPNYKVAENMDDKTFAIKNWYPLTKEEVKERNYWLFEHWKKSMTDWTQDQIDQFFDSYFYGCSQLDEATGRCMTHDNLPKVCSGYPYYGKEKISASTLFYTEDCYYKRDLEENIDQ